MCHSQTPQIPNPQRTIKATSNNPLITPRIQRPKSSLTRLDDALVPTVVIQDMQITVVEPEDEVRGCYLYACYDALACGEEGA